MITPMIDLLDKLLSKTINYQEVLILSNLLWIYHRYIAKKQKDKSWLYIDTSRGWWFTKLVDLFNYVEYQRWAVDIYKDMLANWNKIEQDLPEIYTDSIKTLLDLLKDYLSNKKK